MNGAFKTVADDELVTKYSKKNKLTGEAQSASAPTVPEFTVGTQVEDYSPYLVQMHEARKQAAMAELKTAYDNSMAQLDRAENGLAESYQAARNETAGAHETERRNFAQYAAANGLNSGTAGQAELARSVTLHNNMNDIHTAEANAKADLTLQRAQAETEYNAAIAQAEYTGEYELAAALYEEKVRVQEALTEAEIRQQQYALERYQLQYQAGRDAVADQQYDREQALKEKEQADSNALEWAAQALKEKTQSDELELTWAELTKEEQQALAELALAQQKHRDSVTAEQTNQLVEIGQAYLKAGLMPPKEMLDAMGITAAEANKYILPMNVSVK